MIKQFQNSFSTKYRERTKKLLLIIRHYFFPEYNKFVAQFVKNCHIYFKFKTFTKVYNGFLKPLLVPEQKWIYFMNFVLNLPKMNDFNALLIMADCFLKQKHKIFTTSKSTFWTHQNYVYRFHRIFDTINSDGNTQFVNEFWIFFFSIKNQQRLLIVYYFEIDGQTKNAKKIIKQ